jgi:hypothetical protein
VREEIRNNERLLRGFCTAARLAGVLFAGYAALSVVQALTWPLQNADSEGGIAGTYPLVQMLGSSLRWGFFPCVFLFGIAALTCWLMQPEKPVPWLVRRGNIFIWLYIVTSGIMAGWWFAGTGLPSPRRDCGWIDAISGAMPFVNGLLVWPKLLLWAMAAVILQRAARAMEESCLRPVFKETLERNDTLLLATAKIAGILGVLLLACGAVEGYATAALYSRRSEQWGWYLQSALHLGVFTLWPGVFYLGVYWLLQQAIRPVRPLPWMLRYGDKLIYAYVGWRLIEPVVRYCTFVFTMPAGQSVDFTAMEWSYLMAMYVLSLLPLAVWAIFGMIVKRVTVAAAFVPASP